MVGVKTVIVNAFARHNTPLYKEDSSTFIQR